MKEIKFRVWDKLDRKMHDVLLIDFKGVEIRKGEPSVIVRENDGCLLLKDVELLQFTGLLDKNGKEIYRRDLLTHSDKDIHVVEYNCGRWSARLIKHVSKSRWPAQYLDCTYMGWEVIGNIYQNKHLLEK